MIVSLQDIALHDVDDFLVYHRLISCMGLDPIKKMVHPYFFHVVNGQVKQTKFSEYAQELLNTKLVDYNFGIHTK